MPEDGLSTLRALARASSAARSPEELRRNALEVLAARPAQLGAELAELERLRAAAARLEREARQRAEEASEARARFMDNVSHELRTPLNGIMGYLELLSEGIGGPLTESQERHLQRIRSGALRLKEMIEEILTFSKIEAGGEVLELEDTDVVAVVQDVAALVGPLMDDKALRFTVLPSTGPLLVRTDEPKLRQILLNLLSNAQRYTERGDVRVSVEEDDGWVSIRVSDTGPGIEVRDHERIFHPFQRLYGADQGGGTGLGLSVSRSLATIMGGEIIVESEPGRGSTFVLRLPRKARPVPVAPPVTDDVAQEPTDAALRPPPGDGSPAEPHDAPSPEPPLEPGAPA